MKFPLFKTWQKRLPETPALSIVKEVGRQLNNLKPDGVIIEKHIFCTCLHSKLLYWLLDIDLMSLPLCQLQFIWQPYSRYKKKFHSKLSKVGRSLIVSSTVLVFYWIVEQHNTWRVMKQFGLKQLVPLPFTMPILRRERTFRAIVNYNKKMAEEVTSLWAARA